MPISRNGFKLVGHLNGTVVSNIKRYQRTATGSVDANLGRIFIGDPVVLTSAGTVAPAFSSSIQVPEGSIYLGVCTGITENEQGRPLTFRTRKHSTSADTHWIDVCIDGNAIYEVAANASANQTVLGSLAYIAYSSANTAAGISGAGVVLGSNPSGAFTPFRVIDIKNLNFDGQTNDQDGRVHVVALEGLMKTSTQL